MFKGPITLQTDVLAFIMFYFYLPVRVSVKDIKNLLDLLIGFHPDSHHGQEFVQFNCPVIVLQKTNKTRRGYGRKNKNQVLSKDKHIHLSILGTNANGLIGKQESLKNNINNFKPSIITVQETKVKRIGSIRLKGYQIFETLTLGRISTT